eukprot:6477397-Amphidinium_carterae.1
MDEATGETLENDEELAEVDVTPTSVGDEYVNLGGTVEIWPLVVDLIRSSPNSDFCVFVNRLFALYGTADSSLPPVCSPAKRVLPLGLPHKNAARFRLDFIGSPRRRQRAQRRHQLQLYENLVACALSWLHLGRPQNGLGADLMFVQLNSLQVSLWEPFAVELRRWCRPLPDLCGEGGGLSRCLSKLIDGADSFGYQTAFRNDRPASVSSETITLNDKNLALPQCAAKIALAPPLIPSYVQQILECPGSFRLQLPPDGLHRVHFAVDDWPSVFRAMHQVGLLTLRPRSECSQHNGRVVKAGLFGVPKKGSDNARIIVDRRAQNHLEHSLRSVLALHRDAGLITDDEYKGIAKHIVLPYAGMFSRLLLPSGGGLFIYAEDASDYYYLLRWPDAQVPHTVVGPGLFPHELDSEALTNAEATFGPQEQWFACLTAPAMGDQKAPEIAQLAHSWLLSECGAVDSSCRMCYGSPCPLGQRWSGAYVDDFADITAFDDGCESGPFSRAAVAESSHNQVMEVRRQYGVVGVVRKESKAVEAAEQAQIWGAFIDGKEKRVSAALGRRALLVRASITLCQRRVVRPADLQCIVGHWNHQLAFRRCGLCLLDRCYRWLHLPGQRPHKALLLPRGVRDELLMLCVLAGAWETDLRTAPCRVLTASDATTKRGASVFANMTGRQALWCYNRSDKPASKLFYKGLVEQSEDTFEVLSPSAPDLALEDFVAGLTFHLSSSYAFKDISHINKQELLAWRTALRHGVGRGFLVHSRGCFLIDSQVIVNILRKGRSSSKALNSCLITSLPWQVLGRVTCLPVWIQSKANPADDPTRHCRLRTAVTSRRDVCSSIAAVSCECPWLWHVCNDLWKGGPFSHSTPECVVDKWSVLVTGLVGLSLALTGCEGENAGLGVACDATALKSIVPLSYCLMTICFWQCCVMWLVSFDCTLGYEGEGPPPRASLRHQDLQKRVTATSESRYEERVAAFERWLGAHQFPCVPDLVHTERWSLLEELLVAYLQYMYNNGCPVSHGVYLLAGLQYFQPSAYRRVPRAWLCQRTWQQHTPVHARAPMPESILLALACTSWVLGWHRLALGLLLGFLGMLRPSELGRLRRMDISLPQDLNGSPDVLIIAIAQSKTSTRASRLQSTMITDVNVIALAQGLLCDDSPSRLLISGGLPELSRKYAKLTTILDLKKGFSLGTLRGGGAVRCLKQHKSLSLLQWLGRWSSERSTHHYLQLGVAAATWIDLPLATKALVQQLASHADVILNPFVNGILAANDAQKFFSGIANNPVVYDAADNPVVSDVFVVSDVPETVAHPAGNDVFTNNNVRTFQFHPAGNDVFVNNDVHTFRSFVTTDPSLVNDAQKFLATRTSAAVAAQTSPPFPHWGDNPATQTQRPSGDMAELSLLAARRSL